MLLGHYRYCCKKLWKEITALKASNMRCTTVRYRLSTCGKTQLWEEVESTYHVKTPLYCLFSYRLLERQQNSKEGFWLLTHIVNVFRQCVRHVQHVISLWVCRICEKMAHYRGISGIVVIYFGKRYVVMIHQRSAAYTTSKFDSDSLHVVWRRSEKKWWTYTEIKWLFSSFLYQRVSSPTLCYMWTDQSKVPQFYIGLSLPKLISWLPVSINWMNTKFNLCQGHAS